MQVTTLSYVGVKDVAEGIRSFGKENLLAKLDVKIALQEHTEDRWLMGMLHGTMQTTWSGLQGKRGSSSSSTTS